MFLKLSVFQVQDIGELDVRISGKNQKKCLVIVPATGYNEDNAAFLEKIFSAVQFDLERDIALYAWREEDTTSLVQMMTRFPFTTCLLFGISPLSLGLKMNIDPWKIIHLPSFSLLYCESLTKIATDQSMKKYLWENLKQLWT